MFDSVRDLKGPGMRRTRRVLAALVPLSVVPLGVLPLAACSALSPAPGAAYGASPSASASASSLASGKGGGAAMSAPMIPASAMLTVEKTKDGYVLATAAGRAVYTYGKDVKGSGKSACTGGCLSAWPAVTGKPFIAKGVRLTSALGSITRAPGVIQATYNGYPLYTYAADTAAGQASGDGEGGVWHVVTGTALAASPAAAAADAAASQKAVAAAKAAGTGM
jgi:predicted lipoprotein with Yx(FWY)xxD motif